MRLLLSLTLVICYTIAAVAQDNSDEPIVPRPLTPDVTRAVCDHNEGCTPCNFLDNDELLFDSRMRNPWPSSTYTYLAHGVNYTTGTCMFTASGLGGNTNARVEIRRGTNQGVKVIVQASQWRCSAGDPAKPLLPIEDGSPNSLSYPVPVNGDICISYTVRVPTEDLESASYDSGIFACAITYEVPIALLPKGQWPGSSSSTLADKVVLFLVGFFGGALFAFIYHSQRHARMLAYAEAFARMQEAEANSTMRPVEEKDQAVWMVAEVDAESGEGGAAREMGRVGGAGRDEAEEPLMAPATIA